MYKLIDSLFNTGYRFNGQRIPVNIYQEQVKFKQHLEATAAIQAKSGLVKDLPLRFGTINLVNSRTTSRSRKCI